MRGTANLANLSLNMNQCNPSLYTSNYNHLNIITNNCYLKYYIVWQRKFFFN